MVYSGHKWLKPACLPATILSCWRSHFFSILMFNTKAPVSAWFHVFPHDFLIEWLHESLGICQSVGLSVQPLSPGLSEIFEQVLVNITPAKHLLVKSGIYTSALDLRRGPMWTFPEMRAHVRQLKNKTMTGPKCISLFMSVSGQISTKKITLPTVPHLIAPAPSSSAQFL